MRNELRLVNNCESGSLFDGLCGEFIAVEMLAFQRKKQAARLHLAAVGRDFGMAEIDLIEAFDRHSIRKT